MKRLLYLLAIVPVLLLGCSDFDPEDYEFTTPSWLQGSWNCDAGASTPFRFEIEKHEITFYQIGYSDSATIATEEFSVISETETDNATYTLSLHKDGTSMDVTYTWSLNADGTVTIELVSSDETYLMTRA